MDGEDQGLQTQYATTDTAEEAIAWIEQQAGPWFLWLQFNAPHVPLHAPPARLHTRGDLDGTHAHVLYAAILEATDRELGRVIRAAGDNTTFFVMGDNGTFKTAIAPPFDKTRGKLSIYEGGVQVPLIVAGPDVPQDLRGRESEALVQASDLFATITELAGRPAQAEDSASFAPQLRGESTSGRTLLYTSRFRPNGGPPEPRRYRRAARDDRFKLVRGPGSKQGYMTSSRIRERVAIS